jgi:methylmalonyl-CoA/ethylmalonyl-CoA epimerase
VSSIKKLERISFAVGDPDQARDFFSNVLGAKFEEPVDVEDFKFRYHPFTLGGTRMQLLSSTDPGSVISRFLMKRQQGFHHLTYEVDDLDEAIAELQTKGVEVVSRHDYRQVLEGFHVREAFIHPRNAFGILIQLLEKKKA